MSLFNIDVIKKQVIAYQGHIGRDEKLNSALEKRLGKLVYFKELEIVPGSFSSKEGHTRYALRHPKTGFYLSYESSPSSYGRDENLFIEIPASENSSKNLKKCKQWISKEFKDLF